MQTCIFPHSEEEEEEENSHQSTIEWMKKTTFFLMIKRINLMHKYGFLMFLLQFQVWIWFEDRKKSKNTENIHLIFIESFMVIESETKIERMANQDILFFFFRLIVHFMFFLRFFFYHFHAVHINHILRA